ncbi:TIGR00730 family Rossman fold protein [Planktomarina sp.]|uniref:LOG family protein n=1 Tax=Planktomarina sp. TaxID=2024851 RepID=UPI00326013A4
MGNNPAFEQAAQDLGEILAKNSWRLVYGAGDIGLMGAVANSAQASGASTFGVIPEYLMQREVGKQDVDRFIVTDDMHSRKKLMFINSDAVVLLPGGAGSLDEFFEVLTWAQLGLHSRPIIVANIEGYWQPMLTMVDHVIASGFADASLRSLFCVTQTVDEIETLLRSALNTANQ